MSMRASLPEAVTFHWCFISHPDSYTSYYLYFSDLKTEIHYGPGAKLKKEYIIKEVPDVWEIALQWLVDPNKIRISEEVTSRAKTWMKENNKEDWNITGSLPEDKLYSSVRQVSL